MALRNILRVAVVSLLLQRTSYSTVCAQSRRKDVIKDPNAYYTTVELACSEGYSVQEHKVVTDDGYILTVYRLPNGRNRPKVPRKVRQYHDIHLRHHPDFDNCVRDSFNQTSKGFPLLFVHGIVISSDWWLLQGSGYDLAYIMADRGYDVWLANFRGNFYSRNHMKLSPSDPKFWDFSFHEHAIFDVPATIDHILRVTKKEKLGYIGYSLGTTTFFAMTSLRPEYNEKIIGAVALAPVVYIKQDYMDPKRRQIFRYFLGVADEFAKRGDVHEVFSRNKGLATLVNVYCSKGSHLQDFCYDVAVIIFGYHSKLTLRTKLHLYLSRLPSGTSVKCLQHLSQNVKEGTFKLFDYGYAKNVELYGSPTPPDYPVWNTTVPVALYYTTGDLYYDTKDIQDLRRLLPNVIDMDEKRKFNHGDFLWSYISRDTLYPKVTAFFGYLIEQYSRRKVLIS